MSSDDDAVGYRRPPKRTQFQPGQSGNPQGRAKGVRNLKTDLMEELCDKVSVRENGQESFISKQRAIVKTLVAAAIKGDMRATNTLVSFCARTLDNQRDELVEAPTSAEDVDIIDSFKMRERSRRRLEQENDKPKK